MVCRASAFVLKDGGPKMGPLEGASYRGEDTQADWLTLTEVVMDDVDSEKPWAV